MKLTRVSALLLGFAALNVAAKELAEVDFERSPDALKRGAEVVTSVCMGCHSLHYIKYRDLQQVGFSSAELDKLRGTQGLDEPLLSATTDEMAIELFGLVPPDQSLLAKAREGGAHYIYTLLTSYEKDAKGNVSNLLFPGLRMPDVLDYASADIAQRAVLQQQVRDAAVFLEWASDPHAGERRRIGVYVLGYLVVLTFLLYLIKRRVWARLPPPVAR
ncbi:MAG: cytochrome C [Gammaproteobacteria bacterium]|nr:cytochrome C [Gammaproteobacteria bacterium]